MFSKKINPVRVAIGVAIGALGVMAIRKYRLRQIEIAEAQSFDLPNLDDDPEVYGPLSTDLGTLYREQNKAYDEGNMKRYMEISTHIQAIKSQVGI